MENLVLIFLLLGLVFYEYFLWFSLISLGIALFYKYKQSKKKEIADKQYVELLFSLSSLGKLTEKKIISSMKHPCFSSTVSIFNHTGKLVFTEFGWRSKIAILSIKTALEAGDNSIILKAVEKISQREKAEMEANSALAEQKYNLIASITVVSAIIGLSSSVSGQNQLIYVVLQSFIGSFWLFFMGTRIYEAFSLIFPLSLSAYFLALNYL